MPQCESPLPFRRRSSLLGAEWSCPCATCAIAFYVRPDENVYQWTMRCGWVLSWHDYLAVVWLVFGIDAERAKDALISSWQNAPQYGQISVSLLMGATA
jgi:hypothetical protein